MAPTVHGHFRCFFTGKGSMGLALSRRRGAGTVEMVVGSGYTSPIVCLPPAWPLWVPFSIQVLDQLLWASSACIVG